MNENFRIVEALAKAMNDVQAMHEHEHVHTVTVTLDGFTKSGVRTTVAWDDDSDGYLDPCERITS